MRPSTAAAAPRERPSRLNRIAHRAWGKICGARVAFPLADVYGHGEALVAVVFDGLDLALAHRHRLTVAVGAFCFTGARAFFKGVRQGIRGDGLQRVETVGEAGWSHAGTQRKDAMISAQHRFPGTCRPRKSPARPSASAPCTSCRRSANAW